MGRLSDACSNALLNAAFGSPISPFPASYDVALSTTLPTNNGSNVTEPSGNGYAAVAAGNDATHWGPAASRQTSNNLAITYAQPTGSWGTVAYYCLYDHGVSHSTSTFRGWGALSASVAISAASSPPSFAAGAITITAPGS